MPKIEYKVCVVTVTYGDRWKFLEQVLRRVLTFTKVGHVVVINNASSYSVDERVRDLSDSRVLLINENRNLGSAGGYKRGIELALKMTGADFIWLLDDDNLPQEDCLNILFEKWDTIEGLESRRALFCLREDRRQHIQIAQGEDPYRFYLVPNNFLGFNLFKAISNKLKKLQDRFNKDKALCDVKIPFTPYGGLFLHRSMLHEIGLPDERFYLYVDDTEFTFRITENSGDIWLIPSCKIIDIDKSQGTVVKRELFRSSVLDNWNFRSYYHVRNMIFFNNKVIRNKYIFNINKKLYLTALYLISIWSGKKAEYKKFLGAVNDGLEGKLGEKQF